MSVYRQTGQAVIRGADGTVACGTWTANNVDQLIEGLSVTEEAEMDEIRDGKNETVNKGFTQVNRNVQIDFIPAAAVAAVNTGTNIIANAKAAAVLPTIPSAVTLSAFDEGGTQVNATYIYQGGGTLSYTPAGAVKMTLPLTRPLSNTTWTNPDGAVTALTTAITQS